MNAAMVLLPVGWVLLWLLACVAMASYIDMIYSSKGYLWATSAVAILYGTSGGLFITGVLVLTKAAK